MQDAATNPSARCGPISAGINRSDRSTIDGQALAITAHQLTANSSHTFEKAIAVLIVMSSVRLDWRYIDGPNSDNGAALSLS